MRALTKSIMLAALAIGFAAYPFQINSGVLTNTAHAETGKCPAFIPNVNPWRLQKPVLLGTKTKAAYYYRHAVLAGEVKMVEAFLDCYDLRTQRQSDYASAYRLWAACTELLDASGLRANQIVCVAMDQDAQPLDDRIFSEEYAQKVAEKVFQQ